MPLIYRNDRFHIFIDYLFRQKVYSKEHLITFVRQEFIEIIKGCKNRVGDFNRKL